MRSAWGAALASIKDSTGILFEPPAFADLSLKRFSSGQLEQQSRSLREALAACQTWDALKAQASKEALELQPLALDTSLERLPEAIAARQIETRDLLERLAAPRILQNSLAEILASESPPMSPDGLLSAADWDTILEATRLETDNWALYALALRACASNNPERLAAEAASLLANPSDGAAFRCLRVLSFLSREQFVSLCSKLPQFEKELQALLVAGIICSKRSDYWFWEPLEPFTRQIQGASKWQVLLRLLAQTTIAEAGLETLRTAVEQARNTQPQNTTNLRQALEALQNHLHEPINCSDRSRFRLRQCAYQKLLADLREAVRSQDLSHTRRAYENLTGTDLDGCYDRYASEIHLSSRSLRDHFKEDIEEVKQLTNAWLSASDPPSEPPDTIRLKATLTECLQTTPKAPSLDSETKAMAWLGRWLLAWSHSLNKDLISADFPPETPPLFDQPLPDTLPLSPVEWRAFSAKVERGEPLWGHWSLDQMDAWVGHSNPQLALRRYLKNGCLEAARQGAQLFAKEGIAVATELLDDVKTKTDARRADLGNQRNALRAELSRLTPKVQNLLESGLPTVPDVLSADSIKAFDDALSSTRRRISEALAGYQEEEHRQQILGKLSAICRPASPDASLADLERAWAVAWETTAPRRAHIAPVRHFQALARDLQLAQIADAAEAALANLEAIDHWATLESAGDAALYFECFFLDGLAPLLSQAHNWLPTKRDDLFLVTLSWLEALQGTSWLHDTKSQRWLALKQTAELRQLEIAEAIAILRAAGIPLSARAPQQTPETPPGEPAGTPPATPAAQPIAAANPREESADEP